MMVRFMRASQREIVREMRSMRASQREIKIICLIIPMLLLAKSLYLMVLMNRKELVIVLSTWTS
eukprot:795252-Ditylum_brightwellii.AAC.1